MLDDFNLYYDRKGRRISDFEFLVLISDPEYKIIASTVLENEYWVSTVWLGLNHALPWEKIEIFETMVFSSHESLDDLKYRRYATEVEALKGHVEMCEEFLQYKQYAEEPMFKKEDEEMEEEETEEMSTEQEKMKMTSETITFPAEINELLYKLYLATIETLPTYMKIPTYDEYLGFYLVNSVCRSMAIDIDEDLEKRGDYADFHTDYKSKRF